MRSYHDGLRRRHGIGAITADTRYADIVRSYRDSLASLYGRQEDGTPITNVVHAKNLYDSTQKIGKSADAIAEIVGGGALPHWKAAVQRWGDAMHATIGAWIAEHGDMASYVGEENNLSPDHATTFWNEMARFAETIDTFVTNVPQGSADRLLESYTEAVMETPGIIKRKLEEGAEAMGKGLGKLADTAGKAAGKAAKGFFSEIGPVALVVIGGLGLAWAASKR